MSKRSRTLSPTQITQRRPSASGGGSDLAPVLARGSWVVRGESVSGHMALKEEQMLQQDPWGDILKYDIPTDNPTDNLETAAVAPDDAEVTPDLGPLGSTLPSIVPQPPKLKKRSWGPTSWGAATMARNAAIAKVWY